MLKKLPCGYLAGSESGGAILKKKVPRFPSIHFLLIYSDRVFHITDHTPAAVCAKT